MSGPFVAAATVAIIALSAFFVAVEFALMAARRHRLEDRAGTSRAARAAVRNSGELTLLLAGSQLGITACTLALGAITKPAVHHAITPILESLGLPHSSANILSFVLALLAVTFLHLVVGEMAPKSWALAHPEFAASLLALPMRAFMTLTRPVLRLLNRAANALVRRLGVEPVDELTVAGDPEALRALVEHSANVGVLEPAFRAPMTRALGLGRQTLADVVRTGTPMTAVAGSATIADVQEATRRSGHLRVVMRDGASVRGVVHVRDTLTHDLDAAAAALARPVLDLPATTPLHEALARMRDARSQLVLVRSGGRTVGVVTLGDILPSLLPRDPSG